ncbi:MAG TPA: four helix bundle protein [Gemmatimonadaceae bacterium]|nr:four helix bundle protein [Gemmatimonadaceae bacterium]
MAALFRAVVAGNGCGSASAPPESWIMGDLRNFTWRKAHALALNVHSVAKVIRGPSYASLRSQMIRAAMSVPANIVEGKGQKSGRDFARFLEYAINSSSELEYHLIVAGDIAAISLGEFTALRDQLVEVRRMLHGLQKSVRERDADRVPMRDVPAS